MTGVDKETYELIRWISKGKYRGMPIVTYYYSVPRKQFGLQLFENGSLTAHWVFSDSSGGEDTLRNICEKICIELGVVESLLGHPLSYMRILAEMEIRTVLFIHDFYYLCPCQYLPIPDRMSKKTEACTDFTKLSLKMCEGTVISLDEKFLQTDLRPQVLSEMPFLQQNKEYFDVGDQGISINIRKWRDTAREMLLEYSECVVFSSELMRDTYSSALSIRSDERFIVSYPNFLGRDLRF